MSSLVDSVKKEVEEGYIKFMDYFGMKPTFMQLYLAVFFAGKPIGLREIAKETGYSISTVSNSMEVIERLTDVRSFKEPGSKKRFYECQHDIMLIQRKKLQEAHNSMIPLIELFKKAEETLINENDPETVKIRGHIRKRREEMERLVEVVKNFNNMFK